MLRSLSILSFVVLAACSSDPRPLPEPTPTTTTTTTPSPETTKPTHKRVFITDTAFTGDLGGIDGADAKCSEAAEAAGLGRANWRAWLSTSRTNAVDHIDDVGPWYNLREEKAFVTKESIAQITDLPVIGTAKGFWPDPKSEALVFWTGSDEHGISDDLPTCRDWTVANTVMGITGSFEAASDLSGVNSLFVVGRENACLERRNLLCLEQ